MGQTRPQLSRWFKNALKGQKLLAQGNTLGLRAVNKTPCKGKSFIYSDLKAFALTGRLCILPILPRALPWLGAFGLSARPRLPLSSI